jgi:hypothetical protein
MKELAAALAKVQAEIGSAAKSSTNPHFKSKYADLSEVWAAWQTVGPKNGLSITQTVKLLDGGAQALVTTLLHSSGESITSEMLLTPTKNDMQGIGSAMTYARRYSMAAMVGIVQDDDDGNAASAGTPSTNGNTRTAAPKAPDDPEAVKAREAFGRIKEAINLAKTPADIDTIIKVQSKTLAEIKAVSLTGYEQLMAFANERKENCERMAA